ncbi:helix-turn-helix domain-containing protein [Modicisalibacter xianhensis]|uniref:Transcriptional regulator, Crp/Fnr family n=1 Tax=Modicisalibacter xianhensis TaxID=442341 RepID=A0A1I3A055_9GAMM|nr:helix-turn-helix domain-containing protein [Halomonas xianhensis]SFH43266.1 transcriptional regulator, Crp/Fnr family [Halomonas xianhensis]
MKMAQPRTASLFNQLSTGKTAGFTETDALRDACRSLPALRRKQVLVKQDENFHGLYIVRCGMLKQSHRDKSGDEQITHFFLPDDVIGLDAIEDKRYLGKVTALETVGLIQIPFARLEEFPGAQENHLQLLCYLSRAMQRERTRMRHMMSQASDVRLARFFLTMSNSFKAQGFSPYQFRLPMTRCDIANYLCMAFETTSRLISRFQQSGVLTAHGHDYCIKDYDALINIAEPEK